MSVSNIIPTVVAAVMSNFNNGKAGVHNPSNWPNSAKLGVSYTLHDKQFPQVAHEETVVYFDHVGQLLTWLEEKRDWVRGTDYDFSMNYNVYVWDWGPVLKYTKSM